VPEPVVEERDPVRERDGDERDPQIMQPDLLPVFAVPPRGGHAGT
jgi:hypothetical protein